MFTRDPWRRPRLLSVCLVCLGLLALLAGGPWAVAAIQSTGWRSYHDNTFHFQVPVPPAWHTMSLAAWHTMTRSTGEPDDYCDKRGVAILPPDLLGTQAMGQYHPRAIVVGAQDNCAALDLTHDPNWSAEPNEVNIGGVPTILYDHTNDSSGVSMLATVMFGQRQFLFSFASLAATCSEDSTLFYKVLQHFKYTGS